MRNCRHLIACFAAAGFFLAVLAASLHEIVWPSRALRAEPSREAELARELEGLFSSVAEGVRRSVVCIETADGALDARGPTAEGAHEREAIGSGFVIDERGFIVTNHHLVGGGGRIVVRLHDNRETVAQVIQSDQASDLALIKIDAPDLQAMPLGDSDTLRVGQWVLAIGNPFGLTQTVSAGIISALKRSDLRILPFESFIQTDASINPGNSGGPLVNLRGEAIGINTAIYTGGGGGGNQGIGFAVPVQLARTLVKRWMDGKGASFLGILPSRVDADMARYYGLAEARGAFVARVDAGGPGASAGLQVKDVVISFAGRDVVDENHLRVLIAGADPGEAVEVVVMRGRARQALRVTPLERETPLQLAQAQPGADAAKKRLLGITVTPLTRRVASQLGLEREPGGVVVLEVQSGSTAQKKGLCPADIIVEVNDRNVATLEDLTTALELTPDVAMVRVERGNGELGYLFLPR